MENFININSLTLDCENGVPHFHQYINGFDSARWIWPVLVFVTTVCVSVMWIYFITLKNLIRHSPKSIKSNCISLISIYPIVSVSSLFAIMIPRAYLFLVTIGHVSFMLISYQLYR